MGEVRPATEEWALASVTHRQTNPHIVGRTEWQNRPDRYLIYRENDRSCRETEHSTAAWASWPEIISIPDRD